ncbi:uncharacterized protein B0J16DRAFT_336491 [Fusarium flagelliforme]|uniref:uncharacterized protein n=1 Tax=Fusarium flagelliforme TaxID=2675880 RepID=UPI001E8E896A|nr:uncharacterized protein B0J16DRAFT_336491 [Fusarium flagelliforme]KAH7188140.1 hypothetical protein B0J16DRAFT_336491 [Fusarium flagelliforme]
MPFPKTYFLCPTSNIIPPPPTGTLCLGSIIHSTSTPQYPLNRGCIVPVTDEFPPAEETDWKKTVSNERGQSLGVYAQFLQVATGGLSLGPEVNVEHSNKSESTFAFDRLTTLAFEPTQTYVEESIKAPAVKDWLGQRRQRLSLVNELFMVTGIKIVKGAKIKYTTSKSTTAKGNIGVDVPALGITFGPKGHWTSSNDETTESNRESEFVFAFCVKRLRFGRRLKLQEYTTGAFMTIGGKKDDDECVLVEEVDGANIKTAELAIDETESRDVYCVRA